MLDEDVPAIPGMSAIPELAAACASVRASRASSQRKTATRESTPTSSPRRSDTAAKKPPRSAEGGEGSSSLLEGAAGVYALPLAFTAGGATGPVFIGRLLCSGLLRT